MKKLSVGVFRFTFPLTVSLYFCSAVFPFILDGSQLLLGTVINGVLAIGAHTEQDFRKRIPLIFLPSLATVAKGLLFGPFTPLLLYMIPFIWIGNGLFMILLRAKLFSLPGRVIIAACIKSLFLFAIATMWIVAGILPEVFATSMGFIQLITALLGGFGALGLVVFVRKNSGGTNV